MAHPPPPDEPSYPPMSHPTADPAVLAVTARCAGLHVPDPSSARILEIGCATGHHLLPLAMRWPRATCTGIDRSAHAIQQARSLARLSGIHGRIDFHDTPLLAFDPGSERYDYIIAHGVFSWVPDEAKQQLLDVCARHLTEHGLAVISFNVTAGWRPRRAVVHKARALIAAGWAQDERTALHAMEAALTDTKERDIVRDMLAKGPAVLLHDDFAPICDPWPLDGFVAKAAQSGLRWLGESRYSDNRPAPWSALDERELEKLCTSGAPVERHQWMDERSQRTFRSALLCRSDAPLLRASAIDWIRAIALRPASPTPPSSARPLSRLLHRCLMRAWPSAPRASVILDQHPSLDPKDVAREILHGMAHGSLLGRSEPMAIAEQTPALPTLDPLRLACARLDLPVVDAWHAPCVFPVHQRPLLASFDGTHPLDEIRTMAANQWPRLDFNRWVRELNERGLFAPVPQ